MKDVEIIYDSQAPDREWQVVCSMVETNKQPSRLDRYRFQRDCVRYRRRLQRAYTAYEQQDLAEEYPDIYAAHALARNPASCRWVAEAGVLANADAQTIADYVGVTRETVDTYERLFFNVRNKLSARGYILNQIAMPAFSRGMDGRDFDFMYKIIAYCAGWGVFTDFIEYKKLEPAAETWLTESFESRVKKLGWLAAHRVEVTQYNSIEIITKCLELKKLSAEIDRDSSDSGDLDKQALTLMQELLEGNCLAVLPSDKVVFADEPRALINSPAYEGVFSARVVEATEVGVKNAD